MGVATISIYDSIKQTQNGKDIPVDIFLQYVQDGRWQDEVLAVRNAKSEEAHKQLKEALPYATISGKFVERKNSGLEQHSGFLCIDIDDVDDPNELKSIICPDKYVYAAFVSVSGKGLAVLVKISPDKHTEAFAGLQEYFFTQYQQVIDPSCKDVSRARFVSWDPHLYSNPYSTKFTTYPKKQSAAAANVTKVIYVKSDFDAIINEINGRGQDITGDYHTWLRIGFALADHFGEGGRDYFHAVSQHHPSYNAALCDRQYSKCVRAGKSGITIATFYYHVKQAGIPTYSDRTRKIAQAAGNLKKSGISAQQIQNTLEQFDDIPKEESAPIIEQVLAGGQVDNEASLVQQVEDHLRYHYDFRRNVITRHIEINGRQLEDRDVNTVWKETAKVFPKAPKGMIQDIISSDFTRDYNPFTDFFTNHSRIRPNGVIDKYFNCIQSDTGIEAGAAFFPDFPLYFGKRWLVGMISSIHGQHSPLMLVLTGAQNCGKTEFFRRLLPAELMPYFAESKMDAGKDDDILMCKKMIIFDDEMSGKSKKEEAKMKSILSRQEVTAREPYGRASVTMRRICTFCGTTNNKEILRDPTGNRRIIPINVEAIDFTAIDNVDRVELLMEAYWLWKDGFKWELSSKDVELLNKNTTTFENYSTEYELLVSHFEHLTVEYHASGIYMTYADIQSHLERYTGIRISREQLQKETIRLGWTTRQKWINGKNAKRFYLLQLKSVTI
ncbi:VapE domain-containing protein [Chitinophaga sp. sic0106]|uniref:VapE domain-containing protein n=1 Tax=Chitinophaga sp. sic0106 TaxID=2854785 RepID=UPI001C43CB04|nr:VapE domain-containing protein [Chitinophaga sp. sic0106]MBV7529022.1 PriCT-2 domain-containing protein [Chitinophaga sp. sic0106]